MPLLAPSSTVPFILGATSTSLSQATFDDQGQEPRAFPEESQGSWGLRSRPSLCTSLGSSPCHAQAFTRLRSAFPKGPCLVPAPWPI